MNDKIDVPWNTGVLEGVGYDLAISIGGEVAGNFIGGGRTNPLGALIILGTQIAGTVQMVKTIIEKRDEYREAHTNIESSNIEMEGKLQAQDTAQSKANSRV